MFYKTKLKPEEIKEGQLFITTDQALEEVVPGIVQKVSSGNDGLVTVNIAGEEMEVKLDKASNEFLFGTLEDPEVLKKDGKEVEVAMYQGEGRLLDTLMYIRAQLMEIEKDPHYRMEITNEMLRLNLTRSLAAISIKIRLRGAWETLTNIEKMLTAEAEEKNINS